jgi:zinc protease
MRLRSRCLAVLLLALAVTLGSTALAAPAVEDPALKTRITRLENGMTVLTLEDHSTPVVSLQMWVHVGSRDESRYTGLAHLFEHMMFKGSKHIGPEEHARLLEARGGIVNAYTSQDVTVYHEDVPREALPLAIDLEEERFQNLDISEKTLSSERQVVLEERRLRTEDDPEGRALEMLVATTFMAHPYHHPVIGWRSDVEKVGVPECRRFFDTYYAPNNLVMVVVGDFDTQETLDHVKRVFGRLRPAEKIPRTPTVEPPQQGERRAVVEFDVRSPSVWAAWHAPATGHPDGPALDVAGQILSGGRASRLYRRLVYQEQQALGADGGYWELQDAGLFYATASVRPGASIDRVESLLFSEIARLRNTPVGAEELERAKRQLLVALVNGLATTHALAARIGGDYVLLGRIRPLDERIAQIQAVTAADVQRVARTYLQDSGRSVVRVVPPAAAAKSPSAAPRRPARKGAVR